MEIREHSLIMLRTNYGEPGVMMYNQELNIFIDDHMIYTLYPENLLNMEIGIV